MSDVSNWNTSAASNNSAPPDGAPEGMLPGQVNDAMREMMAATKRWYEILNPSVVSTGAANTYNVAYSVAPTSYVNGQLYSWVAHQSNTGAVTVNISSLGAKALVDSTGNALTSGAIVSGNPVVA